MNKKIILAILFLLISFYPVLAFFQLEEVRNHNYGQELFQKNLQNFQISIWISWIVMVTIAIYYKWTTEKNFFFFLTYVFLLISSIIFGYYFQLLINQFNIPVGFEDNYTFGVFKTLQNFAIVAVLTGFLQAAAWWFTRRWHRRY